MVAYEMEGERTGVGRYLAGLLGGIQELDPGWRWRLFFHGPPFEDELFRHPAFEAVFAGRTSGRPIVWEQLHLPRELRRFDLDLIFSPSYSLPPTGPVPGVVTIHDLSFELLPGELGWRQRWRRRWLARRACRRAARVLVDTDQIRRQLVERYRLPPERVGRVPLAVDGSFRQAGAEAAGRSTWQEDPPLPEVRSPYLLYLGTLLERRNVDLLLRAFAHLRRERPELSLVLAGANRLRRPERLAGWLSELDLAGGQVLHLGYVPEERVIPLYRGALLSFYLSSYEGFGLPPLESLACGTPAVVASGLALDELWPSYPYRCRDLEVDEVARVARQALEDPLGRRRVAEAGVERMSRLTWKRSAELFLRQLEGVVKP